MTYDYIVTYEYIVTGQKTSAINMIYLEEKFHKIERET